MRIDVKTDLREACSDMMRDVHDLFENFKLVRHLDAQRLKSNCHPASIQHSTSNIQPFLGSSCRMMYPGRPFTSS